MSRQINFYLTSVDLIALEARLRLKSDFAIFHSRSHEQKPRIINSVNFSENGTEWLYLYLVRQEDISLINMRHVPAQNYWAVDVTESPVIELIKSFSDGKIMRPGRLFYKESYFNPQDALVKKSEEFCKWANMNFKETKKWLKKAMAFYYMGQDAEKWKSDGGVFLN